MDIGDFSLYAFFATLCKRLEKQLLTRRSQVGLLPGPPFHQSFLSVSVRTPAGATISEDFVLTLRQVFPMPSVVSLRVETLCLRSCVDVL